MPNPFAAMIDWLLTHLVAIGFLLFLLVAIYWRYELFDSKATLATAVASPSVAPASAGQAPPSKVPEVAPAPSQPPAATRERQAPAAQRETSDPAKLVFRPVDQTVQTVQEPAEPPRFVPQEPVEEDAAVEQQDDPIDVAGLLDEARKTFWSGALDNAESLYLRYLSLRPTDGSAFMELGDLYRSMGRPRDALDSYFEAGVRFRSQGDNQHLNQIIKLFLDAGDPRAQQLRQ